MVGHLEIARQQVSALVCTLGLHASCLIIGWGENRSSYFERFKFSFCHNFFSFLSGFLSSSRAAAAAAAAAVCGCFDIETQSLPPDQSRIPIRMYQLMCPVSANSPKRTFYF
jgi:hypothetical protein